MANFWIENITLTNQTMLTNEVVLSQYYVPQRLVDLLIEFLTYNLYTTDNSIIPCYKVFVSANNKCYFQLYEKFDKMLTVESNG